MIDNFDYSNILQRDLIQLNLKKYTSYVKDKRVLITGAGGTIGSEIARQLLFGHASRLYLFGHGENSIYKIEKELKNLVSKKDKAHIIPIIGELQDREYIKFLLKRLNVDVVFHTAAHKHVPLTEANPVETIKNNVFGTKNLVDASVEANVDKFIFISSDKSVEPVCVYGVSKKLAEEIILNKNNHRFLVVRFGNVLCSKGSVIPLFKEQILNGGPVTITDKEAKRFFMTIPEAVSLVLKIGGMGTGGELYLLEMGEQIKITDIAERVMNQMGTSVPVEYTGLRFGDKIEEKLWSHDEEPKKTRFDKILKVIRPKEKIDIDTILEKLKPICFFDSTFPHLYRRRNILREILSSYFPTLQIPQKEANY